jgi:hypothetical protein
MEPAVIDPLELSRQAGTEAEHMSLGMTYEETAQEIIQDQAALDQPPQHLPIGFEPGEIVIKARRNGFGSSISKALARKETAGQRAGG